MENNSIVVAVVVVVLVEYNRIVAAVVVQYNRIVVVVMVVVAYLEGVIFLQLDQNQIVYTLYCFKNRNYVEFH